MLIYDEVKPIRPEYRIATDDAVYCVDDVKALWRIV